MEGKAFTTVHESQSVVDYEQIILQVLMNEPAQYKALNGRQQSIQFNEKELRDAAHAEVANSIHEIDKSSRKRKPMNADEKAKQSRDRNREHAKNTRLRKKAYILKLKQLVDEMNKQKEIEEMERRSFAEKMHSKFLERKNAMLLFLTYRARNDRNRSNWEQILEEDVVVTLPITPYRFFRKSEIQGNTRKLAGINSIMADAMSLSIMVEGIGIGSPGWKEGMLRCETLCKLVYHTSKEDTIAAGDSVMCRFILRIEGHEVFGSCYSCMQPGMLCCKFGETNKISSVEIIFDVMSFMQQLQRTAGLLPEHSIVPNTLEMALQPSNEARVLVKAESPFACLHVNLQFTRFTGFSQSDIENREIVRILNLHESDGSNLESVIRNCSSGSGPGSVVVSILQTRSQRGNFSTKCYIKVLPLSSDGEQISHILLTLTDLNFASKDRVETDFNEIQTADHQSLPPRQNMPFLPYHQTGH